MTARPTWSPSAQDRIDVEAWSADMIGLDEYPDATPMDIAKANLRRNVVASVLAENKQLKRALADLARHYDMECGGACTSFAEKLRAYRKVKP